MWLTTVGWLTSMVSVLPVTADQRWPNRVRPDSRESISHPIEPAQNTPRNRPTMRGPTIATRDRADLGGGGRSGLLGMSQGYHSQVVEGIWAHARHSTGGGTTASPCGSRCRSCGTALRP